MNLSPESRSRPHNLLLVGLTEGKPKDLPRLLDLFSDLQDFMVGDQLWRPIICFVSADLPALAECAGVQGHCAMFGCVRCYMAATRMGSRLCYVGHNRFFPESDARHNNSSGERPRELLFEQLNYIPSELLGDVLGREANSTNCFLGKVAADDIPLIPLDEVRNCIAQSCPVVQRLLSRGKRAYDVYTCRLRARDQNPITFEQWLGYGNLRGSPWTR